MKKKIRIVAVFIATALLILILLSGTIYNFNRPSVTAAMPTVGYLNHTELTNGIVRYGATTKLYAEISGWAANVLLTEGDTVTAGQTIIQMDFRTSVPDIQASITNTRAEFEESMRRLSIDRTNNQIELERIGADIQNIQDQITYLRNDLFRQDSSSDFELQQNQGEINQAEEMLSQQRALFEAGIITGQELADAENNLATLLTRREHLYQQHHERQGDWERERQSRLQDLERQLETRNRDRRSRNLNIDSFALRETTLRRELDISIGEYERRLLRYGDLSVIESPVDGVITYLPINEGQHVNDKQLLIAIGLPDSLVVECEIPLSNTFITVGSLAVLRNSSHVVEGIVTQVIPLEHAKQVSISIESDNVTAGETFTIQFEERSNMSFTIVPNGAISRDSEGYFIRTVRRRRGMLGDEFYTQRLRVMIGDSDSHSTAIIHGLVFFEPIVVLSDRTITDGQSVNLRNESDFFEN